MKNFWSLGIHLVAFEKNAAVTLKGTDSWILMQGNGPLILSPYQSLGKGWTASKFNLFLHIILIQYSVVMGNTSTRPVRV